MPLAHARDRRSALARAASRSSSGGTGLYLRAALWRICRLEKVEPSGRGPSELWSRARRGIRRWCGPDDGARRQLTGGSSAGGRDRRCGGGGGGAAGRSARAGAHGRRAKALGFEELLAGDVEGMKRRTRNYAKRQLTWMRKMPRRGHDRRDRPVCLRCGRGGRPYPPSPIECRVREVREVAGARQRLRHRRGRRPAVRADARSAYGRSARRTAASARTESCCSTSRASPASSPRCGSSTRTARRPSCRATASARP